MNPGHAENRRKLKILITLLYYYPHPTGLTYYVQMFAEEMARRGHKVTVLASRHDKALPKEPETHKGVRIIRVWAPIRLSRGMILPSYPWHLLRLIRQHDIVSIHTPMLETALVSILAGFAGLKVIPTHHGDLFLPDGLLNKAIVKLMYAMYAFMARRAPCIIGFSDDYAEHSYYLRPFRDKLAVLYPPISIPAPNMENAARLRAEWQCDDGPVIGFAGRFAYEKRPDLLIKALDVINRKYPKTRIVFAGEYKINYENTWKQQKALVERYKSQLLFLGLIRDKQRLADFYAACDVLVLPSNNDCFPAVLGESMLCGTPVVMTDVYGGRVPVQITGMGKLAKSGDWQSIAITTLEVLDNRDKYIKPKDFIAERFSLKTTFDRFESVLLQHAREKSASPRSCKRILITLLYYYPHPTGLTNHAQLMAEEMARRGHEVTVLASRHDSELPCEEIHNGVRIIRVWAPVRISRGMIMPTYPWRLFRLMRQHDVVSIHTPMLETALVSFLAGLTGIKVVPTHHGDLFLPDGILNRAIVFIMFVLYRFMARRAPCIVAYSDDYAENSYYLRPYKSKVKAIYPPISIPEPNPVAVKELRAQWQFEGGPVIGFAGRFAHEKRPDLLIHALEKINLKYPNARIVFAGEYNINYEDTWRRWQSLIDKYKAQLIFLGLIRRRQDIANFYAACDVLVQPSNNECFGLTQVEAMLCGTPVVMTDVYGGRVPVKVTGMGKLAKSGDSNSIALATLEVLENRAKFIKSKDFVRQRFSQKNTFDQYESIFLEYARQ